MKFWPNAIELAEELKKNIKGKILPNHSLKNLTWFKVGGLAEILFIPEDVDDLVTLLKIKPNDTNITIIGNASNLLVRDDGIPGIVITLGKSFNYIEKSKNNKIICGGALQNKKLSSYALTNNIGGVAFLSNIPGTIGGSIKMNSGAHGYQISDILIKANIINSKGDLMERSFTDLSFGYRKSNITDDSLCVSATITGYPSTREKILSEIETFKTQRLLSQPIAEKTGGSTFKNPTNKKAWELIQEAGCADLAVGDAFLSELHSNFIINRGSATAYQIELLGERVRKTVMEKTGVNLEWEIRRLGQGPSINL